MCFRLWKKKSLLIGFIIYKYSDDISYNKIFEYLQELYGFNPLIIHSDFENGISLAILTNKIFNKNIIHVKCFFHFCNVISLLNSTEYASMGYNHIL